MKYTSHKTTAAQNENALSYYKVRGLYFLAVVFVKETLKVTEVKLQFNHMLPAFLMSNPRWLLWMKGHS